MENGKEAFVAPSAAVSGEVSLGEGASVWHNATLRGDLAPIRVGRHSNVQDGAVLHVALGHPCVIGDEVTVGHGAIVHGCTVGDRCLVGMGSILLDGCAIGEESIVGAGALVTEGKQFPPRSLVLGSPARKVRDLSDEEVTHLRESAAAYFELAQKAAKALA